MSYIHVEKYATTLHGTFKKILIKLAIILLENFHNISTGQTKKLLWTTSDHQLVASNFTD
jgi:hypothetical protein